MRPKGVRRCPGTPPSHEEGAGVLVVRLFGQVRVEVDDAILPLRAPAKAREALAYLAVNHDAPVGREFLAGLVWPDDEPEDGRAKLRRNLHVLVRALPPGVEPYFITTPHTVRWNRAAAVVDVVAFGDALSTEGSSDPAVWYTGEFLEGFHSDWVLGERERLRALQLERLRISVRHKRSERDLAGALKAIARMLEIDPWREDALRVEMLVRAQLGDRSGAIAAYRNFAERLRRELDVEPAAETRAAFDALVHGGASGDETANWSEDAAAYRPKELPFVGRQAEFSALCRAWESAARGKGRMVLVAGEAGAGKSRLGQELALHVESQGGAVLLGTTTPGEARPYEALVDALRTVLSLVLASHSEAELSVLARVLPEIAARANVVETPAFGPEAERARIFAVVHGAIAALSRKRPLLVILEDLHWATASSVAMIEYLVRRIVALPVLVVGTCRSEEVGRAHPLRGLRRRLESEETLERIALGRFDRAVVAEIAQRVFGESDDPQSVAADLYRYSEGVPLFLDEAIHAGRGAVPGARLNVPERLERLGENARLLVEIAGVVGAGFTVELLSDVAGWDEADVLRALDELVESRFVREGGRRAFGDYVFSHHLVQAAVYESLTEATRRRRHLAVARASSMSFGERADRAAAIALHYDRGGDPTAAASAYAVAAVHAMDLFASDEALAHAERALALGCDPTDAAEMQIVRATIGHWTAESNLRENALAAVGTLALTPRQLPRVERLRIVHAVSAGRLDEASTAAERFLRSAEAIGDGANVVIAHLEKATIAITGDRYAEAEEHLERARRDLSPADDVGLLRLLRAETYLAQRRGSFAPELPAAAQRLLAEARRVGDPHTEAEAHNRLAHVAMSAERFSDARAHFVAGGEAYHRLGLRGFDGFEVNAANLAAWLGDYAGAERLYRKCLTFIEERGGTAHVACSTGLALIDICTGRFARAKATAENVAQRCRGTGTLDEANVHLCFALIASESGAFAEAQAEYDASLAIHRGKPPGILFAATLAFATLSALDAGAISRATSLGRELDRLPDALRSGEEFPHLMAWADASVARANGDVDRASESMRRAGALYDERLRAIGSGAAAYGAVPWNARFVTARASIEGVGGATVAS